MAIAPLRRRHLKEESEFSWVHHTDGYHYKQHADGSFEPTPHTKNEDGTHRRIPD